MRKVGHVSAGFVGATFLWGCFVGMAMFAGSPVFADDEEPNPYLAPEELNAAGLGEYLDRMLAKPESLRRRQPLIDAVIEAADRILKAGDAADGVKQQAILAKFEILHESSRAGNQSSDERLEALTASLKEDKRPAIARQVRFHQLEYAALSFEKPAPKPEDKKPEDKKPDDKKPDDKKPEPVDRQLDDDKPDFKPEVKPSDKKPGDQPAGDKPKAAPPDPSVVELIEAIRGFLASEKVLEDRHIRLASADVRVINMIDDKETRNQHYLALSEVLAKAKSKRLKEYSAYLKRQTMPKTKAVAIP